MRVHNDHGGFLYHYAHFLCDCLYPEVVYELYRQPRVYRVKSLDQTIGLFSTIYEEVMNNKSIEVDKGVFDKLPDALVIVHNLRRENQNGKNLKCMPVFRNYVFQRYSINPEVYDPNYPSVVLIKRGSTALLTDKALIAATTEKKVNRNGSKRREITDIHKVEEFLQSRATSYFLEEQSFKEQVQIFNNAKVIILAHGAAMSNMFFCKKGTTVIEVTCGRNWPFFDTLSKVFQLNHIKVTENTPDAVIKAIQTVL
jgi:hypothetical protein